MHSSRPDCVALALVEDVRADDVGRQQVRRALDPGDLQIQRARERASERRLADPGQVLDERVALGEDRDDEVGDDVGADLRRLRDVRRHPRSERAGRLELRVRQPPCAVRAIHLRPSWQHRPPCATLVASPARREVVS
jgi:hypothetical protein